MVVGLQREDPSKAKIVIDLARQGRRLAQVIVEALVFVQREQHGAKRGVQIDRLLEHVATARETISGGNGLLQIGGGRAQRQSIGRLCRRLPQIRERLVPRLGANCMVGETVDVFGGTIAVESLDGFDDPGVQLAAPALEDAPVRYLVGESVLEGVFDLWKQAGLVKELTGLEPGQDLLEIALGRLGDLPEQDERDILADDSRRLEHLLVIGGKPIDARGEDSLHGGGHVHRGERLRRAIRAPLPREHPRLDQVPHALLEE